MWSLISSIARTPAISATMIVLASPVAADAATYNLTADNVVIENPSPLFTSPTVSGTLTLADTVMPGQSFGSADILGLTLNIGGITGTLADIQADIAPGPVQAFGTRSADGTTFSVFDLRFGFPSTVAGCGFVCAGQIIINSPIGPNDPSNFIAINDPDGTTLSIIDSYDAKFTLVEAGAVPEPTTWGLMLVGFGAIGFAMRRRAALGTRLTVA